MGTVGTLEEHVGVCQFTLVPCPKKCKDDNGILKIMRRDLQQHLMEKCPNRDYLCEHCGLKGTYATTLDHYDTCEKKIITCTNEGCTMKMERMKIKNHLSEECEHTVISCKYARIRCDVKLKRKDMRAHEQDDKAHLNKAVDTIVKLQTDVVTLEKQIKERDIRLENKISEEITKLSKKKDDQLKSELVKLEVQLGTVQSSQEQLRNQKPVVSPPKLPLIRFRVTDIRQRNGIFTSPSFYTSLYGYHMDIKVYVNGEGSAMGSHVSVYVYLIKGKYDDRLNWPFEGDVTIELLNQLEDKNHHSKVVHFTTKNYRIVGDGFGFAEYISHSKLSSPSASNTEYLKNDTLYFRIFAKVSDCKPWLQ